MNWLKLTDISQINEIDVLSISKKIILFKHSTRCSISNTALNRIERMWKNEFEADYSVYYLDLLNYRSISNEIANHYEIRHESPQLLIIRNGKCILNLSHSDIHLDAVINL